MDRNGIVSCRFSSLGVVPSDVIGRSRPERSINRRHPVCCSSPFRHFVRIDDRADYQIHNSSVNFIPGVSGLFTTELSVDRFKPSETVWSTLTAGRGTSWRPSSKWNPAVRSSSLKPCLSAFFATIDASRTMSLLRPDRLLQALSSVREAAL